MNHYLLLVILVLATALLMHGNRPHNKAYVIVASLLLFSIYGLRNTYVIGNDTTSSYLHSFQAIASYSWGEVIENYEVNIGFGILLKLGYSLTGGDYQLFVSAIALFVTLCFGMLLYRYSPSPVQSILYHFGLLLFVFHFSALKQSIAMALLMPAFHCLVCRKNLRYLLLVLLASQFHFPAIVFLLAFPLSKLRVGRNYLFLLAGMLLITFLLRNQIINLMLNTYNGLEESTVYVDLSGMAFLQTKALIMIVIVLAAVVFRRPRPEDYVYSLLLEFMGIAVVFQTFCGYNNIFERLADYFFQFSVVFIPMVFDSHADRQPLIGWRLMSIVDLAAPYLFCGYGIYRFLSITRWSAMLYPFRFFFER